MSSLVVLNFFPAFTPAASGGEMRLGKLYRALSHSNDVTILTSTDFGARFEEIEHTPRLREIRFPKNDLWRNAYATLDRSGVQGELSGLAFALAVSEPSCELRQRARLLAQSADAVIHEFPYSEPIFADGCPCREIYNSHNFEVTLLSSIVRGAGLEDVLGKLIRLEGNLAARAERVFAVSVEDAEKFRLFYGLYAEKLGICPNGIDPQELMPMATARARRAPRAADTPKLFFIGSAHHPNVEAAEFLISIAVDLSECEILLAGSVCKAFSDRKLPRNVSLLGLIDPLAKSRLLSDVDLFVNPVVLGSGTSLKALEALGAALPMVSTFEGVRGLKVEPGVHCEVVERTGFVAAVRRMLRDADRRQSLAAAGQALAHEQYSWERIAADFDAHLGTSAPKAATDRPAGAGRPLVLALNDYPVLQSGSGGVARIRALLSHLDCEVALLSLGDSFEVGLIAPGILHATIPKTPAHRAFQEAVNRGQRVSVDDGVASLFAASNKLLTELVGAFARRAEATVFEHPYMVPVLDVIAAIRPGLPVIYSAHNVETTHKQELLRGHPLANTLMTFIAELERRLVAQAQLIVCCTDADAAHFASAAAKTVVVPNGCAIPEERVLTVARQSVPEGAYARLGFLGSSHGPNVDAANFIVRELAPAMPGAQFELIGSVCNALTLPMPHNVTLHGVVDEPRKTSIMAGWDIALNPVQSGGGSSLKLSDYMAHALATLSTPAGARGFAVEEHEAGRVVETGQFREVLGTMLADREALLRQQANARRYAIEELTWGSITVPYRQALGALLKPPAAQTRSPRLLVVTYRYTEPSLGGAEEYLIEILKRLRPRLARLDLAAIDIDQLTNRYHFGCRMSSVDGGASRRLSPLFDQAQFFRPDELPEAEMYARARNLERAWTREEQTLLCRLVAELGRSGRLRVFGGFFAPENHHGAIRRWTSPNFSFLVPRQARSFWMSGHAAADKMLRISLLQISAHGEASTLSQYQQAISPNFSLSLSLPKVPGELPLILCFTVDEHEAPGDYRPFGVFLESASALLDEAGAFDDGGIAALRVSTADLTEQHDEELRVNHFDRWVPALRDIARERDASMEAEFAAVRGPHSQAMQAWLLAHAHEYDVVLVQGIPFDVIPSSVETLSRIKPRPRVVTLPHFHGDDRFYHWRRYFESFSAADVTLLFSSSIAEHLQATGRSLVVVPGGGIRADEHGDPTAESSFRSVHRHANPYFVVLGRKTASKGYELILRAHQALRQFATDVDLILIGPDEDGRQIDGAGVHYLGRQPREVIRGALRCCLGLVTMSRSESFGIVICEAWLFGKPVIANRACYAFRELVRDGETGMLVTTERELTEAMCYLVRQPHERARMGYAGFQQAITQFTWERVAGSCFEASTSFVQAGPSGA